MTKVSDETFEQNLNILLITLPREKQAGRFCSKWAEDAFFAFLQQRKKEKKTNFAPMTLTYAVCKNDLERKQKIEKCYIQKALHENNRHKKM